MKNNWILILIVGLAAGLVAACDDADSEPATSAPMTTEGTACTPENAADVCDGFACNIPAEADAGVCFETCATEAQCLDGFSCEDVTPEAGTAEETASASAAPVFACIETIESSEQPEPFTFVSVVSQTTRQADIDAANPGPDVDFIEVLRDGTRIAAANVVGSRIGTTANASFNCDNPESVLNQTMPNADGECTLSDDTNEGRRRYFCLGSGAASDTIGFVTVDFGADFEFADGDQIRVWELAPEHDANEVACTNTSTMREDQYAVYIGRGDGSADPLTTTEDWSLIDSSPLLGGVITFDVVLPE